MKVCPGSDPNAQQAVLEMLGTERLPEQGILTQIDHARTQVVAGSPVSLDLAQLVRGKGLFGRGRLQFVILHHRHKNHTSLQTFFELIKDHAGTFASKSTIPHQGHKGRVSHSGPGHPVMTCPMREIKLGLTQS